MSDACMTEPAGATRRGMALAAVGAAFTAAVAFAPAARAAETPPLQVSYSTDRYMTCEALQEEVARKDLIVAAQGATAPLVKTARERKLKLGEEVYWPEVDGSVRMAEALFWAATQPPAG